MREVILVIALTLLTISPLYIFGSNAHRNHATFVKYQGREERPFPIQKSYLDLGRGKVH